MTSLNQEWLDFQNNAATNPAANTIIKKSPKHIKKGFA